MKIEILPQENHQVTLTVEVDPEQLEAGKLRGSRELAKKTKIPGFRPGKAPYKIVLRHYGEEAILEEAIEILVNDVYPKALEQSEIKPFGPGTFQKIESTDPLIFKFLVPLQPEVVLGDYKNVRYPYEPPSVEENEIDKVLENIREQQAILEPVERAAEKGDVVTVLFSGERDTIEEQKTLISNRSVQILVRSDNEDDPTEWPYPGFSKELYGMSTNESKSISHTYSDSSNFESLRGVKADFQFEIENVKSRTLPEFNNEFAASIGEYENLEALRKEIKENLTNQKTDTYNNEYNESVVSEIISLSKIDYPPQMLESEIDDGIRNLERNLEEQKLEMDLYLKSRKIDIAGLRDEIKPAAENRLKHSLVIAKLAKVENIQINPSELEQETTRAINSISQSIPEKDLRKLSNKNLINNIVNSVYTDLITRKTLERLRIISSGMYSEIVEEDQPSSDNHEDGESSINDEIVGE